MPRILEPKGFSTFFTSSSITSLHCPEILICPPSHLHIRHSRSSRLSKWPNILSVGVKGFRIVLIFVATLTSKSAPSQLYALRGKEHLFPSLDCITSQFYQAAEVPALQEKLSGPNLLFVYMALFHMLLSIPSSHLDCHLSNTSLLHENTHLHYDNLLSFSTVVVSF